MTLRDTLLLFCIFSFLSLKAQNSFAYLRSNTQIPWSDTANEDVMDEVFGAGNWDDLRFETVNLTTLLAEKSFIFMEGGENTADEMETFLDTNITAIENWVNGGGALFLNSAPTEGDGMSLGFGGTSLDFAFVEQGDSMANHAILLGRTFQSVIIGWVLLPLAGEGLRVLG